jgi:hypothetical protein
MIVRICCVKVSHTYDVLHVCRLFSNLWISLNTLLLVEFVLCANFAFLLMLFNLIQLATLHMFYP